MEKVDTLVVDKTGTLTEGKPKVVAVVAAPAFDETEVLRLAASVERASEHPLARAVVASAGERGIALGEASEFDAPTGKGVRGTVEGRKVVLGNARFLADAGVLLADFETEAERLRAEGATVVYLGVDGRAAGLLAIADPVKPRTPDALHTLAAEGVRVV